MPPVIGEIKGEVGGYARSFLATGTVCRQVLVDEFDIEAHR
ncbi:hypothetical protein ES703_70674 [subsurface metagenome]